MSCNIDSHDMRTVNVGPYIKLDMGNLVAHYDYLSSINGVTCSMKYQLQ